MTDPTLQSLCAAVDGGAMMRQLATLAQWVKLSGTEEEAVSLRHYSGRNSKRIGFRTALLHHDAYISLPGAATVTVDNAAVACITHSFSRATDGLTAPVVYVGAGDETDFAGRDVSGRIVLVDGIATPPVSRRATLAGAAGQLHISPHEHLHEMCISPVWGNPSSVTLEQLPGTVVCSILPSAGDTLRERVRRGEQPRVVLRAEVDTGWRKTPILQADMDAPDPAAPFILFSGHHDTWYYGAMDNGSANATMLEVARLCASHRDAWRRGLRLCFWSGHSHGRYSGSTWYVDQHWDELDQRCAVHLNVDSPVRPRRGYSRQRRLDGAAVRFGRGRDRHANRPTPAWQTHEPRCRSIVQRPWIAGPVRRHQRTSRLADRRALLVVAHASRSAGEHRRSQPGARHPDLRTRRMASVDRSRSAAGFRPQHMRDLLAELEPVEHRRSLAERFSLVGTDGRR